MAGYRAKSPRGFRMRHLSGTGILLTDAEDPTSGLVWSQVVAVAQGVPANVVAIWSQSGDPTSGGGPAIGPLSCGFGGAPRGIRTPNRQIRSLVLYPLS
jgi:hypothetical protein